VRPQNYIFLERSGQHRQPLIKLDILVDCKPAQKVHILPYYNIRGDLFMEIRTADVLPTHVSPNVTATAGIKRVVRKLLSLLLLYHHTPHTSHLTSQISCRLQYKARLLLVPAEEVCLYSATTITNQLLFMLRFSGFKEERFQLCV
jgi:hypothetical protein